MAKNKLVRTSKARFGYLLFELTSTPSSLLMWTLSPTPNLEKRTSNGKVKCKKLPDSIDTSTSEMPYKDPSSLPPIA